MKNKIMLFFKNKYNIVSAKNDEDLKIMFMIKLYKEQKKTNDSVTQALKSALLNANQEDIIYVGGSTFVVAEII